MQGKWKCERARCVREVRLPNSISRRVWGEGRSSARVILSLSRTDNKPNQGFHQKVDTHTKRTRAGMSASLAMLSLSASKARTPMRPVKRASHVVLVPTPKGLTIPIPVTTTRRRAAAMMLMTACGCVVGSVVRVCGWLQRGDGGCLEAGGGRLNRCIVPWRRSKPSTRTPAMPAKVHKFDASTVLKGSTSRFWACQLVLCGAKIGPVRIPPETQAESTLPISCTHFVFFLVLFKKLVSDVLCVRVYIKSVYAAYHGRATPSLMP